MPCQFQKQRVFHWPKHKSFVAVEVTDGEIDVTDIPSPPGKPAVLETDDTSANVCWDEPKDTGNSTIDSYIIEYQEINTTE